MPAHHKDRARAMVAEVLAEREGWVRINAVRTAASEADLDAVAGRAAGIRIPKVESAEDAQWVADRAPARRSSARSRAPAASSPPPRSRPCRVSATSPWGRRSAARPQRRQRQSSDPLRPLAPRRRLARRRPGASDRQRLPHLDDDAGLREQATFAHSLGFFGKSAIHPRQLPIIHEAFTPTEHELTWAREVVDAFDSSDGDALQLPTGEFVDVPVAQRARRMLELAAALTPARRCHRPP